MNRVIYLTGLLLVAFVFGCDSEIQNNDAPQFTLLKKEQTGLDFVNTLEQSPDFNVFNYMYFFNGGGLAGGDFNQDGLIDLYFTSNMGDNKLFLNNGNLQFKDVTALAGLEGRDGWTTGASVVDINNDGLLDIYVSQLGQYQVMSGRNQLYICEGIKDGIPQFREAAAEYGLDLVSFSTQATFFDYDRDGDLDMYQLNHSLHQNGTFGRRKTFQDERHPLAGDRLLRNENGKFVDVSQEAGIYSSVVGYGLGVVTGDINLDGWPDIYVGNDFHENDYLYLNNQDGTFREVLTEQMNHTSRFSMGVDMGDINNDGWSEIISLDMLPYDPFILKSSLGEDGFSIFRFKLGHGYNPQFARNNLQLNNGNGTFSEIGIFSGVHATDWSWAPLFLDFDHDGYRDLFVSNGIPRRMNDIDYVNFKTNDELKYKEQFNDISEKELSYIEKMPQIKLANKFYRNSRDLKFEDIGVRVEQDAPSYSNGAIYADLDNDGDLDIVVNNIDNAPYLYQNLISEQPGEDHQYLSLDLRGNPGNRNAIGARVIVFKGSERMVKEHYPVRGYQSSMQTHLHLGVGQAAQIDSVLLIWPDGTYQPLEDLSFNTTTKVTWKLGLPSYDFTRLTPPKHYPMDFVDVTQEVGLEFKHEENPFVEFNREGLIPHMVSAEGPALAVGDVNGDGLEDVFIGSSKRRRSALFLQEASGKFSLQTPQSIIVDSIFEDVDAVFADIENDGDLDLVIASGGNEYRGTQEPMKQRAYINDGKGGFIRKDLFPEAFLTASCVLPADFNGDGRVDFFFGARAIPWNYGKTPSSYLYENKGDGTFEEVTAKYADDLQEVGLVKNGSWSDIDLDGDQDLILAVEWEPLIIFRNDGNRFEKVPVNDAKGWWNFVLPGDFDQDGDVDLLAGNFGQNTKLDPSVEEPVRMFVNDFDDNGQIEQVLTYHLGGREIPFATYAELTKQMVSLKKRFLYSKDLAAASLSDIFGKEKLAEAKLYEANTFQSAYFEQVDGQLKFKMHYLPDTLQFSTLNAIASMENAEAGKSQFVVGGNFLQSNIEMGWYDANYGNVLTLGGEPFMNVQPLGDLRIKGEVRRIQPITINGRTCYIFAKNNDFIQVIRAGKGNLDI